MAKLPSLQGYGLAQAPAPNPAAPPDQQVLAGPAQQQANMVMQQAQRPNPLQQFAPVGIDIANQMQARQQQEQDREDAIARSMARTQYFAQADQLMSDAKNSDITSKAGFESLTKSLGDLREKAVSGYGGSDKGREALALQLAEAHSDYFRNAVGERGKAVDLQFKNEVASATNRLASQTYNSPASIDDMLKASDTYLGDMTHAMNPQQAELYRQQMHSDIAFSAVDGLINNGGGANIQEAELLRNRVGSMLSTEQQSNIDRRLRQARIDANNDTKGWEFGPDGVYRNKFTGQQQLPDPGIQSYYRDQKTAGAANTNLRVDTTGMSEFAKERGKSLAGDMQKLHSASESADEQLRGAETIDKLLSDVGTGTWTAAAKNAFLQQFPSLSPESVGSREAAASVSGGLLLQRAAQMAGTMSDRDVAFLKGITMSDAQTASGRQKVLYTMRRASQFNKKMSDLAATLGDLVQEGKMTEGNARMAMSGERQRLSAYFNSTFSPPGGAAAPTAPSAPLVAPAEAATAPAASGEPVAWVRDKDGKLVRQ